MRHDHNNESGQDKHRNSRGKWAFIGFLVIAGYFLLTEHRAHLSGWLSSYGIWLLLLACPLLHIFMHGGHGGHGDSSEHTSHHNTDIGRRPDSPDKGESK
jgi:hypothetical protein